MSVDCLRIYEPQDFKAMSFRKLKIKLIEGIFPAFKLNYKSPIKSLNP